MFGLPVFTKYFARIASFIPDKVFGPQEGLWSSPISETTFSDCKLQDYLSLFIHSYFNITIVVNKQLKRYMFDT